MKYTVIPTSAKRQNSAADTCWIHFCCSSFPSLFLVCCHEITIYLHEITCLFTISIHNYIFTRNNIRTWKKITWKCREKISAELRCFLRSPLTPLFLVAWGWSEEENKRGGNFIGERGPAGSWRPRPGCQDPNVIFLNIWILAPWVEAPGGYFYKK